MKLKFRSLLCPASLSVILIGGISPLRATTFTWDPDTATTGVQEGNGTWTPTSINFWTGTANASPTKLAADSIQFGVATTGTNNVTLNGSGSVMNYSDSTSAINLTINHGYVFSGATSLDGLSIGNVTINNGATVTFNAKLIGGIPSGSPLAVTNRRTWTLNNGSTLTLSAGGTLQNISIGGVAPSVLNLTGGTFTAGGTAATTGTPDGNVQLGGGGSANPAILTINHGAGATVTSTVGGNYNVGGNASANATSLTTYNLDGGTIGGTNGNALSLGGGAANNAGGAASMAIFNLNSGSYTSNGQIRVANDGGSGALNIKAGTFTTNSNVVIARRANGGGPVSGTVSISGGVVKATQFQFGDSQPVPTLPALPTEFVAGSTATLNLSGGAVYLGNGTGFVITGTNPNLKPVINLSGGTLGASANWATAMPITLIGAGTTFKTGNDASPSNAFSITLNGNLTGTGALRAGGGDGILTINGSASSYSGGTFISSGTVYTGATNPTNGFSSLGTGGVTVTGERTLLNLQNTSSISDGGTLTIDSLSWLGLNFTGVEVVGGVVIKTTSGDINLPPGDYTQENFNSYVGLSLGEGTIRILPGYASWAATNAGGQAANLDYDKDGVPNGVEYFFGATGSSFTANPSVVNGKITWPMSSAATGATYKVQTSTTLAGGSWSDVAPGSLVVTAGTPTGSVAYTLPTSGPKLFVRLVVTIP